MSPSQFLATYYSAEISLTPIEIDLASYSMSPLKLDPPQIPIYSPAQATTSQTDITVLLNWRPPPGAAK